MYCGHLSAPLMWRTSSDYYMFIGAGDLTGALYVMQIAEFWQAPPIISCCSLTHWYSFTQDVLKYQLLNEDYEMCVWVGFNVPINIS